MPDVMGIWGTLQSQVRPLNGGFDIRHSESEPEVYREDMIPQT